MNNSNSLLFKSCAAIAALVAGAGCASHSDYAYAGGPYSDAHYDYDSRYDRYGYDAQRDRNLYRGIDGAREAHRRFSEHQAESLDGDCERTVRIRRGETLSDIAEFCDAPVAEIIAANHHIGSVRSVAAGEYLTIPNVRGEVYAGSYLGGYGGYRSADYRYDRGGLFGGRDEIVTDRSGRAFVTVGPGDTLAEIARDYDVSLRDIAYLNPGVHPRDLRVGERIYLPVGADWRRVDNRSGDIVRVDDRVLSIWPRRGPRDGEIRVTAEGLREGGRVRIFVGRDRNELSEIKVVEADGDGRIDEIVRLPSDYGYDRAYWALRPDGRDDYIYSDPYAIDAAPARRVGANSYVTRGGETLAGIASQYDVTMQELVSANPGVEWSALPGGAQLSIPADVYPGTSGGAYLSLPQRSVSYGETAPLIGEGFPPETPVSIYAGENQNTLALVAETRTGPTGAFRIDADIPDDIRSDSIVFVAAIEDGARTILSERVKILNPDLAATDIPRRHVSYGGDYVSAGDGVEALTPRRLERGVEPVRQGGFFSRFRRGGLQSKRLTPGGVDSAGEIALAGVLTDEGVNCPALRDDAGNLYSLLGDLEGYDDGDRVLVKGSGMADDRICGQGNTVQIFTVKDAPW